MITLINETYERYVITARIDNYRAIHQKLQFSGCTPFGNPRHATKWIVDDNNHFGYDYDDACDVIADMAERRDYTLECDNSFVDDAVTYRIEMIGDIVDNLDVNIYDTHVVIEHREIDEEVFRGSLQGCKQWMAENTFEHPYRKGEMISVYDDNIIEETGEKFSYTIEEL